MFWPLLSRLVHPVVSHLLHRSSGAGISLFCFVFLYFLITETGKQHDVRGEAAPLLPLHPPTFSSQPRGRSWKPSSIRNPEYFLHILTLPPALPRHSVAKFGEVAEAFRRWRNVLYCWLCHRSHTLIPTRLLETKCDFREIETKSLVPLPFPLRACCPPCRGAFASSPVCGGCPGGPRGCFPQ